jgi:hypothetical protein
VKTEVFADLIVFADVPHASDSAVNIVSLLRPVLTTVVLSSQEGKSFAGLQGCFFLDLILEIFEESIDEF